MESRHQSVHTVCTYPFICLPWVLCFDKPPCSQSAEKVLLTSSLALMVLVVGRFCIRLQLYLPGSPVHQNDFWDTHRLMLVSSLFSS